MQQNRLHVLFFGLLAVVGLLLALTLISDHMSARAEEIQTECVQLTSVALHPGGRTIGGPGVFAGQCDGIPRPILKHGISGSTSGVGNACVTVTNTGTCPVVTEINRESGGAGILELDPGDTGTLCSGFGGVGSPAVSVSTIEVTCVGEDPEVRCAYVWRVDRSGSLF
jgi:hypothetical protein